MNVPLSWLAQYVTLPKSEKALTDRLTMIGHMLDKRTALGKEVVIDLELRGNRADLFGLVGIAREVAAAFNTGVRLPKTTPLPKVDSASTLVTVEAAELIKRFTALTLSVHVTPSPKWLVERLKLYGIPSINNVVDITNYVMVETGEPMHAFDLQSLKGERLILRRAKKDEPFMTFLGTQIKLTPDDLVLADTKTPQGTMIIGGKESGVSNDTKQILLEAAVYDQANVRQSSRRHSIRTEAGMRHEKFLDPNQVTFALGRALDLLKAHASAKTLGKTFDFYPQPRRPITLDVSLSDIKRLIGVEITPETAQELLETLGFAVKLSKKSMTCTVPTFRTDVEESADVIEEVARLFGYEKIPTRLLSGQLPEPATPKAILLEEKIRNILVHLQSNEVITSPLMRNDLLPLYQQNGQQFASTITLVNPPDKEMATLRPSLIPNLVQYAKRAIGFRQERIAFFEVGRIYSQKKKNGYTEERMLGVILAGTIEGQAYTLFDLKGVCEGLLQNLGVTYTVKPTTAHPSMDEAAQGIFLDEKHLQLGMFGIVETTITQTLGINQPLFIAELSIDALLKAPKYDPQPYSIAPAYPPVIEDLSFVLPDKTLVGDVVDAIKGISENINSVKLVSQFENTSSLRIEFLKTTTQITSSEVTTLRNRIIKNVREQFSGQLKG